MKRALFALIVLADVFPRCGSHQRPEPATPLPVAQAASPTPLAPGTVWRIRDNGKRCLVAPCPSWTLTDYVTQATREVTDVDLTGLKLDPKVEVQIREQLFHGDMVAIGEIVTVPKAGPAGDATILRVATVRMTR